MRLTLEAKRNLIADKRVVNGLVGGLLTEVKPYNVTIYVALFATLHWRRGVPLFLGNGWFRNKPELRSIRPGHGSIFGGLRFKNYVERFKVYALPMNIKDKARKRALLFHCARPKVQDIFDTLEDTGEDFETVAEKLMEYLEPRKHHLFNIYQFRQLTQEKEESYDDFATRLKQAAGPCDFPTDWRGVEIQLQT